MQQGLRDVAEDAAERGVGFVCVLLRNQRSKSFWRKWDAAILIGDENPLREPERWRVALAKRLKIPYWTVDADVVVPVGDLQPELSSAASFQAASEAGVGSGF